MTGKLLVFARDVPNRGRTHVFLGHAMAAEVASAVGEIWVGRKAPVRVLSYVRR
jgi:hypothetical protein